MTDQQHESTYDERLADQLTARMRVVLLDATAPGRGYTLETGGEVDFLVHKGLLRASAIPSNPMLGPTFRGRAVAAVLRAREAS